MLSISSKSMSSTGSNRKILRRRGDDGVSDSSILSPKIRKTETLNPHGALIVLVPVVLEGTNVLRFGVQLGRSRVIVWQIPQHYLAAPDPLLDARRSA